MQVIQSMSTPVCAGHAHPLDLLCAEAGCSALMCDSCFQQHHALSGHSRALMLNPQSIGFFLDFSNFLVQTLEHCLQVAGTADFRRIFEVKAESGKYAFTTQSEGQMSLLCCTVLTNYRNLIDNNRAFVLSNRENRAALHSPDFFRDFTAFLLEGWSKNGYSLAEQLKEELVRTYPYRFSYKNIRFEFNADILKQVESARSAMLETALPHALVTVDAFHGKNGGRQAELSNEARVLEEIRTVPQSLRLIDSFEEILDCSYFSRDTNKNQKRILEQSIETLSPNFLSLEDMEKQIQLLLIKNETLKQENYELRFENQQLKQENALLKQGKKMKKNDMFQ